MCSVCGPSSRSRQPRCWQQSSCSRRLQVAAASSGRLQAVAAILAQAAAVWTVTRVLAVQQRQYSSRLGCTCWRVCWSCMALVTDAWSGYMQQPAAQCCMSLLQCVLP
jgi:hypothetical protein